MIEAAPAPMGLILHGNAARVAHAVFEWLALAVGALVYRRQQRSASASGTTPAPPFAVIAGCLAGAAVGNKLAFLLEVPQALVHPALWMGGQSIIGGLLGGWLGVEAGKKIARVATRTGDAFVVPILCGLVIGRIGCFVAGLEDGTYGIETTLPWGVDFGDGVRRHPTQLYEALLAALALATWPAWRLAFRDEPGVAFRVFMLTYLLWRLAVDAIKPVPYAYAFGLSGLQWLCVLGIVVIAGHLATGRRQAVPGWSP